MSLFPRSKDLKSAYREFAVCVALFSVTAAILFICGNFHVRRINPFEKIELRNVLTAKTDEAGDLYVIDGAMSRIMKIDADGIARYEITGGNSGAVFYNAYDIAAEDASRLFVHDVVWDSSGMSVAFERILEFGKDSGSPAGEAYRLDRGEEGSDSDLSGLIALRALKFGNGKLWFVRKSEDSFTLYSLVPGEKPVEEHAVRYDGALLNLDDFEIDIEGERIFFADKGGVIKVFGDNGIKTVFSPVSGMSVKEFSMPYRLSFDGAALYFSDIGKRAVMRFDGENNAETVFGGRGVSDAPPLYYSVHSGGDLLTLTGEDCVVAISPGGRETRRVSLLPAGPRIVTLRILFWVSALVIAAASLLAAAAIFRLTRGGKMSGKEGLSLAIIASATLTFAAITPTILESMESLSKEEIMNRMSYVMEKSSKILDTEAFAGIKTPQDYNGPAYIKFKRSLNELVDKKNEWNERIYCDVFKFGDDIQYSVCFLDGTIGAFAYPKSIEDSGGRAIAESGERIKEMNYQDASGTYMFLRGPIYDAGGGVAGGIEIGVEARSLEESIFALSKNLIVRTLLMLALGLFIVSEILEYVPFAQKLPEPGGAEDGIISSRYCRPVTFLVFLTFNLTTAFLPNYALKMGGAFMGFSPTISAVLPITASDVTLTATPLISPFLISVLGHRLSFFLSFVLCAVGYAICAAAATITPLIAGMGVLGLGAGNLFTLIQISIASESGARERERDFSSFTSSGFSGMNCGIMIGGIIAADFGQKIVFLFGTFMWAAVMAVFLILTKKSMGQHSETRMKTAAGPNQTGPAPERAAFSLPLGIPAFLLLYFLPFMMYSGFMYYLVPVFGDRAGFSDTELSLVFMFFGVGVMFIGPKIAAFLREGNAEISRFLRVALVIELCGILCFASSQSSAGMLLAVFILGAAYGIGGVYFPLYLTEMPEAGALREGGAMALFNFTEGLGLAASPVIFSLVFHAGAVWYYVLAAAMLLSSLFYSAARRGRSWEGL
jgi:predicted MFS family arabinose efflux permease